MNEFIEHEVELFRLWLERDFDRDREAWALGYAAWEFLNA
jgi:hypothetical protein